MRLAALDAHSARSVFCPAKLGKKQVEIYFASADAKFCEARVVAVSVIVAFESEKDREAIASLLEKNGLSVRCACRTGQEAIRAYKQTGNGTIVCGFKFPDMPVLQLAHALDREDVAILVVAKGTLLDLIEDDRLFRIPAPFRPAELVGAVRMLEQLQHRRGKTARTEDEKQLISDAKTLLMEQEHFTEEQAHRYLQRQSMETSLKLVEVARLILASYE